MEVTLYRNTGADEVEIICEFEAYPSYEPDVEFMGATDAATGAEIELTPAELDDFREKARGRASREFSTADIEAYHDGLAADRAYERTF